MRAPLHGMFLRRAILLAALVFVSGTFENVEAELLLILVLPPLNRA